MTLLPTELSIVPPSGFYGIGFNQSTFAIPESLSTGKCKDGFQQQTFLGASIASFNINAGYGDSTTSLSIDLVNDEYNISDSTPMGDANGDDIYHNGIADKFSPPPVGSPVYFKFGKTKASIEDAFGHMYDSIYNVDYAIGLSGQFHLCFGGILQSYAQNRGPGGNPLYSAQIVDPREILSNVQLILNNYAGTTFNNQNMFNLYGFLEFNPTPPLKSALDSFYPIKDVFRKTVAQDGTYSFSGLDLYADSANLLQDQFLQATSTFNWARPYPAKFPMTGTGFSRRCSQGIPFYRVRQALAALLGIDGQLPQEYIAAGFGGYINFRGHNYIIDLGGLKQIPDYYFFDFDQINLLDFCLEICDITSSELFVSLLPITSHPICSRFAQWNSQNGADPTKLISGIIRIDSIDKSFQPKYGAIKAYIDTLVNMDVPVENQDVGFELSNVVTDKFIVGAQEVDMYYFSNNNDRDELTLRETLEGQNNLSLAQQWRLNNALKQQILPYYGLLGDRAVTIPKGYGSYQQILLDSSHLNANGVGKYYVATELELRAALTSYEQWAEFLLQYNDIYMEPIDAPTDAEVEDEIPLAEWLNALIPPDYTMFELPATYLVTVPRCVFDSDNPNYGADDLPLSPCSPPFGYPLYYKRATKLGVQGAGLSDLYSRFNGIITSLAEMGGATDKNKLKKILNDVYENLESQLQGNLTALERSLMDKIKELLRDKSKINKESVLGLIQDFEGGLESGFKIMNRLSKRTKENSMKVYNFIKSIAEECLGKKFLVKIPKNVNLFYNERRIVADRSNKYIEGPFGFKPRAVNAGVTYEYSDSFRTLKNQGRSSIGSVQHPFDSFLIDSIEINQPVVGALRTNFNPLTEAYEFNYMPEKQGGYFDFDLLQTMNNQVIGVNYGLIPKDFTKFTLENSRMSAYVRYNNSQYLAFNGVDSDSFTQQVAIGNNFVPDLAYQLDNVSENREDYKRFDPSSDNEIPPPVSIAFVKCDIDEKFYMPPKRHPGFGSNGIYAVTTHGNQVKDIKKIHQPRKKLICDQNPFSFTYGKEVWIETLRYFSKLPIPVVSSGGAVAMDNFFARSPDGYIKTKNEDLDTNNVYALITIPGRISATQDSRFRDSIMQSVNPSMLKHFLTMDVVKIPEFQDPKVPSALVPVPIESNPADRISAQLLANLTLEKTVNYSLHNRISFASPSPIYPDLVVLPLLSKERCYGPWISSLLDGQANVYRNIGGKIEFLKDENLSPWNYQGYDLMNEAGITQAQFSNSLLLQSERGGFVVPAAPSGIAIGRALSNLGPLVTNISIDISSDSVKSTIKMDLYTASFGKLQKQKQDAISNISRERQKLRDEKNAMIRKGIAKNQTNVNYNLIYKEIKGMGGRSVSNDFATNSPNVTRLIGSVVLDESFRSRAFSGSMYGDSTETEGNTKYGKSASLQSDDQLMDTANHMPDNISTLNKFYNSASIDMGTLFSPYSKERHNDMPYVPDNNEEYNKKLYDINSTT